MKFLAATISSLIGLVAAKNVVELTTADFDSHLSSHKFVLAEFYAPWCGHCKQLKEPYEEAATLLKDIDVEGGLSVVAIDATVNTELANQYSVSGYPTLKWIVDSESSDYSGGRTKEQIVAWVTKKVGPQAKTVDDEKALKAFKESSGLCVFGYFPDRNSDAAKAFLTLAGDSDDIVFSISSTFSNGLKADTLVFYRDFEDEPHEVVCDDSNTFKECVGSNSLPIIVEFSDTTAPKIFGGATNQHVMIFLKSGDIHESEITAMARPVAIANKGKFIFVKIDSSLERLMSFFSIAASDVPAIRIVKITDTGIDKYAYNGDFTEAGLTSFLDDFTSGALTQDLISEDEIPDSEQPSEDGTFIIVGTSHERVVSNTEKNVFVEYYSPNCGHCKSLAPHYAKLAEKYKDDDKILIAKMDSTLNEAAGLQISGFPTLIFYPAGDAEKVDFSGSDRTLESLEAFVEENRK